MPTIEERVISVVAEQLKMSPGKVKPSSSVVGDLGADSLDAVEIVMALESEFDLMIPEEEVDKLLTIKDITNCINNLNKA